MIKILLFANITEMSFISNFINEGKKISNNLQNIIISESEYLYNQKIE